MEKHNHELSDLIFAHFAPVSQDVAIIKEVVKRAELKLDQLNGSVAKAHIEINKIKSREQKLVGQLSVMKWIVGVVVIPVALMGISWLGTILA